jgi:hypothetical protein
MFDYDGDGDASASSIMRNDVPRVLRTGKTTTTTIDAADNSQLGEFVDVTDLVLSQLKQSRSQDMAAVTTSTTTAISIWPPIPSTTWSRSGATIDAGDRPRVAEIWPRVGSIKARGSSSTAPTSTTSSRSSCATRTAWCSRSPALRSRT